MDFDVDEEESNMDEFCPSCHREYDEIDYEYQICTRCGFVNDNNAEITE